MSLSINGISDTEDVLRQGEAAWDQDHAVFSKLKIMRRGYEFKKEGNPKYREACAAAAPLIAKGKDRSDADEFFLATILKQLFYAGALSTYLKYTHPSTAAEKLGVDDTIKRLIQAGVGIPSMEDWLQIFDKVENKANTEELEQEQQEQEEEDADLEADDPNKDASKAERHSASRRLVVKKGDLKDKNDKNGNGKGGDSRPKKGEPSRTAPKDVPVPPKPAAPKNGAPKDRGHKQQ
jgi:hypothetical protein